MSEGGYAYMPLCSAATRAFSVRSSSLISSLLTHTHTSAPTQPLSLSLSGLGLRVVVLQQGSRLGDFDFFLLALLFALAAAGAEEVLKLAVDVRRIGALHT